VVYAQCLYEKISFSPMVLSLVITSPLCHDVCHPAQWGFFQTGFAMNLERIPPEYRGWWKITETSIWESKYLHRCGTSLISLTGHGDRLRMYVLLAYVTCKPTKTGVSFKWNGSWEWDSMSGSGRVKLRKDGHLEGILKWNGDEGTFTAERSEEPSEPIADPPDYRDKWKRRR